MNKQELIRKYEKMRDDVGKEAEEWGKLFRETNCGSEKDMYYQNSLTSQIKYNTILQFLKDLKQL